MDVLADLFHDGIAAFGEQLFVFGYQVVAVGINRDNQRAELRKLPPTQYSETIISKRP